MEKKVKNIGTGEEMTRRDFSREAVENSYNIKLDKKSFRRGYPDFLIG